MKKHKIIFKNILFIVFTGVLWIIFPGNVSAQNKSFSEIAVTAGGPGSLFSYDVEGAAISRSLNFNFGLEYTYHFNTRFGMSLGAEYQSYKSKANAPDISGAYETLDFEAEHFEFRYSMKKFQEEQKIGFINIPIMFLYQNQEYHFYVRGGGKIGIPILGKFDSNYDLSTSGYYPQYNGELFDPEFMGFGQFDNIRASGNSDFNISYIASLEIGIKHKLGKNNLYLGFYIDYGLNDISDKKKLPVNYVVTENDVELEYNSILNSEYVDEIKTMAFGVKLRYSIFRF